MRRRACGGYLGSLGMCLEVVSCSLVAFLSFVVCGDQEVTGRETETKCERRGERHRGCEIPWRCTEYLLKYTTETR